LKISINDYIVFSSAIVFTLFKFCTAQANVMITAITE